MTFGLISITACIVLAPTTAALVLLFWALRIWGGLTIDVVFSFLRYWPRCCYCCFEGAIVWNSTLRLFSFEEVSRLNPVLPYADLFIWANGFPAESLIVFVLPLCMKTLRTLIPAVLFVSLVSHLPPPPLLPLPSCLRDLLRDLIFNEAFSLAWGAVAPKAWVMEWFTVDESRLVTGFEARTVFTCVTGLCGCCCTVVALLPLTGVCLVAEWSLRWVCLAVRDGLRPAERCLMRYIGISCIVS